MLRRQGGMMNIAQVQATTTTEVRVVKSQVREGESSMVAPTKHNVIQFGATEHECGCTRTTRPRIVGLVLFEYNMARR